MDTSCLFIFAQAFLCASILFVHLLDVSSPAVCLVLTPVCPSVCLTDRPSVLLDIFSSFLSGCSSWSVHLFCGVSSSLSDVWPQCSSDLAVPLVPLFFTTFLHWYFLLIFKEKAKKSKLNVSWGFSPTPDRNQHQTVHQHRTHHLFHKPLETTSSWTARTGTEKTNILALFCLNFLFEVRLSLTFDLTFVK